MGSEEIALVLSHCRDNHHSQLLFQQDSNSNLGFRCNPPQQQHQNHRQSYHHVRHTTSSDDHNDKTTRELTGFIEHQNRHFQPQAATEFRRSMSEAGPVYHRGVQEWDVRIGRDSSSPSGNGSESDVDEEEDDDDMGDVDVNEDNNVMNAHKVNVGENSIGEKNGFVREVMKDEGVKMLENDVGSSSREIYEQGKLCQYENAITIADPNGELYYSQLFNGVEGSGAGFKEILAQNSCGFSGRKDVLNSGGSGDSLRTILSDPLTGALMEDAMILPCGHSFGSSGMQHVMQMKACYTCSHPVSETSVAPNLSLRYAIQAFIREEELQTNRASKKRNRFYQDKSKHGDLALADQTRGRGVQFPFCVSERVIIKGNKRTPPRFVGREAVVTTQCLNGWYVVKTLDNAESVKLQYRSLAKIRDSQSSNLASTKITTVTTPNWL